MIRLSCRYYQAVLAMGLFALLAACAAKPPLPAPPLAVNGDSILPTVAAPLPVPPRAVQRPASVFNAGNRFTPWQGRDRYLGDVQPLLGKRCVSCHGCTDAPCQLKLNSFESLDRGATSVSYFALRLLEAPFPDTSQNPPSFHPVVARGGDDNLRQSLLHAYISAGLDNQAGDSSFHPRRMWTLQRDLRRSRKHACVSDIDSFNDYMELNPGAGMPLGLPALARPEYRTLETWIAAGSPGPLAATAEVLRQPAQPTVLRQWEQLLNRGDNKTRLVARYLFEHVFATHIHFDEMPGEFYRLVRAATPPGSIDVDELVTPLPTDRPPQETFYYRFKKITALISRKDHTVWRVSAATLEYLDKLFLQTSWGIPDHELRPVSWEHSSPFANFAQIPATLRYRFMLDNARTLIDAMVRSSACIGRTATYAISDHFWIFFLRPESDVSSGAANFRLGDDAWQALAANQERFLSLLKARDHYEANRVYTASYENALRQELAAQVRQGRRAVPGLGLTDLWNGDRVNPNAWLTVLRHDASASVHSGHRGGLPQTIWVLNYANFERIFYNLVVDFKFWGGLSHKIVTWQAMSQHRLEGEDLFLSLLPEAARTELRKYFSGNLNLPARPLTGLIGKPLVGRKISKLIELYPMLSLGRPALTPLPGRERADLEFLHLLREYMGSRISGTDVLNYSDRQQTYSLQLDYETRPLQAIKTLRDWEREAAGVLADRGRRGLAPVLPGITYIRVGDERERRVYSLISNRGYLAHELLFSEKQLRDRSRDTLSLYPGMIGDYPEMFLDVPLSGAEAFLRRLQGVTADNAAAVLAAIRDDFAITRDSTAFWPFVDWLHEYMVSNAGDYIGAGILDLSEFDLFVADGEVAALP